MIDALDLNNYSLNLHALPNLLAAVLIIAVAVYVDRSVRGARVGVLFTLFSLGFASWLAYRAPMYAADSPEVALWWASWMGFSFPIMAGAYVHFIIALCGREERHRLLVTSNWMIAAAFVALQARGQGLIAGMHDYWWGYVPHLTPTGRAINAWLAVGIVAGYILVWREMSRQPKGSVMRNRMSTVLLAQSVMVVGFLDTLSAQGIGVYQMGWLPAAAFSLLLARATWSYRLVDITPELAAERVIEHVHEAVLVLDNGGRIRMANDVAARLLSRPRSGLLGEPLASTLGEIEGVGPLLDKLGDGREGSVEIATRDGRGRLRWHDVSLAPVDDSRGRGVGTVVVSRETTRRKRTEEALRDASLRDVLTGLANRRRLHDELTGALARQRRDNCYALGLLFIDLDGFKPINDRYGHAAGDQLLKVIAARLTQTMRGGDTCARIGGDEFAVVAHGVDNPRQLADLADRLVDNISQPITIEGATVSVGASIGAAVANGQTADHLLQQADQAMYAAKRSGGRRVEVADLPAPRRPGVPGKSSADAGVKTPAPALEH